MSEQDSVKGRQHFKISEWILAGRRWQAGIVAVSAAVILFSRCSGAFLHPEFWAEDGTIFWQAGYNTPWALFAPYEGYLHLAPRLVASLSQVFPVAWHPALFAWSSLVISAWAAYTIAEQDLRYAWVLGLTVALLPYTEVLATITNVHWTMACALFTLVLVGRSRLSINTVVFAVIASLTGPFSIFAAPVAAYNFLRTRNRNTLIVAVVVGLGGVVQFLSLIMAGQAAGASAGGALGHGHLGILAGGTVGRLIEGENVPRIGMVLILVGAMTGVLIWQRTGRIERLLAGFMLFAVWLTVSLKWGGNISLLATTGVGDRYFHILAFTLILFFLVPDIRQDRVVLLASAFFAGAYNHSWEKEKLDVQSWWTMAPKARSGELLAVPTNPNWWAPITFAAEIPAPACTEGSTDQSMENLSAVNASGAFQSQGDSGSAHFSVGDDLAKMGAVTFEGGVRAAAMSITFTTGPEARGQHMVIFDRWGRPRYFMMLGSQGSKCTLTFSLPRSMPIGRVRIWDTGEGVNDWVQVDRVAVSRPAG